METVVITLLAVSGAFGLASLFLGWKLHQLAKELQDKDP